MDHIALVGVEALEAADVEEEVETSEVGGSQVGDVSDDVGDALRCLGCPGLDRGRVPSAVT
jgi:hypothetical protein